MNMNRLRIWTIVVAVLSAAFGAHAQEDQFFDSDGVKLRYIVKGEGEPVVLIHGFTASIEMNWKGPGVLDALAQDYQVIAFDNRGHGKSGKPHGGENYGKAMSEDIVRLLDHLTIEKAHIVGYSLGGIIALNFTVRHPERTISTVVGGQGYNPPDGPNGDLAIRIAESLEKGDGLRPLIELLTPADRPKPTEEQIKMTNNMLTAVNDVQALAGVMRGMSDLVVTPEQLKKNTIPTLGLVGSIDPLRVMTEAMRAAMANVKDVVVLDGADHMSAMSHPGFLKAIQDFLAANGVAKSTGD